MNKNYKDSLVISDNIILFKEDFGDVNFDILKDLLAHVDIWLMDAIEQPHFSSKKTFIIYKDNYPMCCDGGDGGDFHLIFLAPEGDYWCQWVYQFSHEYCHHLINGPLDGEIKGLAWFEETVCELSSMFCLYRMLTYCQESSLEVLNNFVPWVRGYLGKLLSERGKDTTPLYLYINAHQELLLQSEIHRKIYSYIAGGMLPLFLQCPSLWRIILHFGNMKEWQSLDLLFDHLREEADITYSEALKRLREMLLGS